VVLLVTLAALGGAIAYLTLRPARYEATAQMLVTPLPQDDQNFLGLEVLRDSGDPTRTVQTAATLIETREAADRTARKLGGGWTGEQVLGAIEVEPEGESNVLGITASADGADISARLANDYLRSALAIRDDALKRQVGAEIRRARARLEQTDAGTTESQELATRVDQLESAARGGDPTLALSQAAPAGARVGAAPPLVLVLALMAGLALGSGASVLMELFERRVRSEEELAMLSGLPILARVPYLSRRERKSPAKGPAWYMPPGVREGFRTLLAQITGDEGGGKTLMLTSASRGDGKTTSAVNLAVALAAAGKTVVLLDFDVRKPDVGSALQMEGTASLTSLLNSDASLEGLLAPAPHLPSLSVLPTGAAEGDPALVEAVNRRLPEVMAEARALADYVVVDTAPLGEVSDALPLTHRADDLIVVARPGHTNRTNMLVMRDLLERSGRAPIGMLLIGEAPGAASTYYGYGLANRPLLLEQDELAKTPPS